MTSPVTPRHLAILAVVEQDPLVQPDEIAARLGEDVGEVDAMLREMAEAGMFDDTRHMGRTRCPPRPPRLPTTSRDWRPRRFS